MKDENILIKKSGIGQFEDGLGVFANRDFKQGEVVIQWNLKILTEKEYEKLPKYEQTNFCHERKGITYYYPESARHVNRSKMSNLVPDFDKQGDVAQRDIRKGEELSIPERTKEDS